MKRVCHYTLKSNHRAIESVKEFYLSWVFRDHNYIWIQVFETLNRFGVYLIHTTYFKEIDVVCLFPIVILFYNQSHFKSWVSWYITVLSQFQSNCLLLSLTIPNTVETGN